MTNEEAYELGWMQGYERGATDTPHAIGPIDFDDHEQMAKDIKPTESGASE